MPAGVVLELPVVTSSVDPGYFPEPDKFDALRFYKMRMAEEVGSSGEERGSGQKQKSSTEVLANTQFVSVSQSSLTFGYVRHACPGRFFAANELKMILSYALTHYDFKLPDGVSERYSNKIYGSAVCSQSELLD